MTKRVTKERVEEIRQVQAQEHPTINISHADHDWHIEAVDDLLAYIYQFQETLDNHGDRIKELEEENLRRQKSIHIHKDVGDNNFDAYLEAVRQLSEAEKRIERLEREVWEGHEDDCWVEYHEVSHYRLPAGIELTRNPCTTCCAYYAREYRDQS